VLLISIDPERDTPAAMNALAVGRHVDTGRWSMARADEATVRKIAALLNVQYRKLPNGDFNHSTVIALLSPDGELRTSTHTLGHADAALLVQLRR
jgi:protein SCO1/2